MMPLRSSDYGCGASWSSIGQPHQLTLNLVTLDEARLGAAAKHPATPTGLSPHGTIPDAVLDFL